MQLTNYESIYLVTIVLQGYTIALLFRAMFNKNVNNMIMGYITYFVYYCVVSALYIFINIPTVTMIANLILLYILTLNYKAKTSKRILVIVSVYTFFALIEVLVVFLLNNINLSINQNNIKNDMTVEIIIVRVLSYASAIVIGKLNKGEKDSKIRRSYWMALLFIPLGIMYVLILIIKSNAFSQKETLASAIVLLLMNLSVFFLYDQLSVACAKKQEEALTKQQNNYYHQQFELMQESINKVRTIQHDLKNHLFVIKSFIDMDNPLKAKAYISKILNKCNHCHEYVQSGNVVIDSILNYKLGQAEEKGIETDVDVLVPKDLSVTPFSMSVILGNLLDNAVNATEKLKNNKKINIIIKHDKNMLMIKVDNTFDGNVMYKRGKIITTHVDKKNHGLGLQSINRVLEQHDGEMTISHENNIFSVTSLIYV